MNYTRALYYTSPVMVGDDVKEVQTRLSQIGFYTGSIDRSFGPATKQAVIKFQADGGLAQDGSCGPATWDRLFYLNLKNPQKHGSDIKKMQQRLVNLKYNPGTVDGYFGSNCQSAVSAFQSRNSLVKDGSCGPATWNKLFSTSANFNSFTRHLHVKDGYGVNATLERGVLHVNNDTYLSSLLKKISRGSYEAAIILKLEYKRCFGVPLNISDQSVAVEILGHVYPDKVANYVKNSIPSLSHLANKITSHTNIIDIGEKHLDSNRGVWDSLAPFYGVINAAVAII